uniref:PDZ domain-containing protein n=1 Tax=Panagrellus redivivus TaxID=6233 RepID=A0A7E4VA73_PANRE
MIRQTDNDYVTILAIGEDSPPAVPPHRSAPSPTVISVDERYRREPMKPHESEDVVEITNLVKPPGLTVHTDIEAPSLGGIVSFQSHRSEPSSSATTGSFRRSPTTDGSARMSAGKNPVRSSKNAHLSRSQDRKSRITNGFYEARERLEETLAEAGPSVPKVSFTESGQRKIRVVFPSESVNIPLGIDIAPVLDGAGSVMAFEVTQVHDDGRVAIDGRISVGDQITEINRSTVSQMSLHQAYKCLRELTTIEEPELAIIQVERKAAEVATDSAMYAVQKANSTAVTNEITVSVTKSSSGFGFAYRHRKSGSTNIIIINTVHVDGPAFKLLKVGDRLLQVNDISVSSLSQAEITSILRSFPVSEAVSFTVSRDIVDEKPIGTVSATPDHIQASNNLPSPALSSPAKLSPRPPGSRSNPSSPASRHRSPPSSQTSTSNYSDTTRPVPNSIHRYEQMVAIHEPSGSTEHLVFDIPFVQSRSAGLGIQVACHPWGLEYGPGLYIKKIIHGSAAHKDGRLRVCDRLVGINHIDFRRFENYKVGFDIFSTMIKALPLDDKSARISVVRNKDPLKYRFDDDEETTEHAHSNPISLDTPSDADEVETVMDAFNRLNPTRKSISEKRPFGSGNEAAHSQTFQKIVHQRQTSAPTLNRNKDIYLTFNKRPESFSVKLNRDASPKTVPSPDENRAPSEGYMQAVRRLQETAALEQSQAIVMRKKRREESQEQKSPGLRCRNKITSIVDFFRKKNKSPPSTNRRSMFFDPVGQKDPLSDVSDDEGAKPSSKRRSVSHEPQDKPKKTQKKTTSDDMVHEVIAGTKKVDDADTYESPPSFRLRNKKIEPAPSFKQAMANNQQQKQMNSIMHALISSEMGPDVLSDLRPKLAAEKPDKSRRKSMGLLGFLRRDNSPDKHKSMIADDLTRSVPKRQPPPYNAVRNMAAGDGFSPLPHPNGDYMPSQGVFPPAKKYWLPRDKNWTIGMARGPLTDAEIDYISFLVRETLREWNDMGDANENSVVVSSNENSITVAAVEDKGRNRRMMKNPAQLLEECEKALYEEEEDDEIDETDPTPCSSNTVDTLVAQLVKCCSVMDLDRRCMILTHLLNIGITPTAVILEALGLEEEHLTMRPPCPTSSTTPAESETTVKTPSTCIIRRPPMSARLQINSTSTSAKFCSNNNVNGTSSRVSHPAYVITTAPTGATRERPLLFMDLPVKPVPADHPAMATTTTTTRSMPGSPRVAKTPIKHRHATPPPPLPKHRAPRHVPADTTIIAGFSATTPKIHPIEGRPQSSHPITCRPLPQLPANRLRSPPTQVKLTDSESSSPKRESMESSGRPRSTSSDGKRLSTGFLSWMSSTMPRKSGRFKQRKPTSVFYD